MTDSRADVSGLRSPRNRRIVLMIVAGVALLVAALFLVVARLTQPVVDVGDSFMTALNEGDFPRAYALSAPDLQRELGSAQKLASRATQGRPADWGWSSRSIRNGMGRVSGSYTSLEGRPGTVALMMRKIDGEWRITAFSFSPE